MFYMFFSEDQQQVRLKQLELQYNFFIIIFDCVYQVEFGWGKNFLLLKGVQGLFQFMLLMGRDYGLNLMDDCMDFNKFSEVVVKYLVDLFKDFDGDVNKVVVFYNWGQNNVKKYGLGKVFIEMCNYFQKIMLGLFVIYFQ